MQRAAQKLKKAQPDAQRNATVQKEKSKNKNVQQRSTSINQQNKTLSNPTAQKIEDEVKLLGRRLLRAQIDQIFPKKSIILSRIETFDHFLTMTETLEELEDGDIMDSLEDAIEGFAGCFHQSKQL